MKKKFEIPTLEIVSFINDDIITDSDPYNPGPHDPYPGGDETTSIW